MVGEGRTGGEEEEEGCLTSGSRRRKKKITGKGVNSLVILLSSMNVLAAQFSVAEAWIGCS